MLWGVSLGVPGCKGWDVRVVEELDIVKAREDLGVLFSPIPDNLALVDENAGIWQCRASGHDVVGDDAETEQREGCQSPRQRPFSVFYKASGTGRRPQRVQPAEGSRHGARMGLDKLHCACSVRLLLARLMRREVEMGQPLGREETQFSAEQLGERERCILRGSMGRRLMVKGCGGISWPPADKRLDGGIFFFFCWSVQQRHGRRADWP